MGPSHNKELPRSITQILRDDPNVLNWEFHSRLHHFERVVAQALGVRWVPFLLWSEEDRAKYTDAERDAFQGAYSTIRHTSHLMLALLHGKTHETVDWDEFGRALDEVIWAIDCNEF
jgi:hypothetical protein